MKSYDNFDHSSVPQPMFDIARDEVGRVRADMSGVETHSQLQTQVPLDPFDNDQGIEYWLWNGVRLVPAWPDEIACIRERERMREEQFQADMWRQQAERRRRLLRPFSRLLYTVSRAWTSGAALVRHRALVEPRYHQQQHPPRADG